MAGLSLTETKAVAELADVFYNFMSGSWWQRVAIHHGLEQYWTVGGSKNPAIVRLLEMTLLYQRSSFCGLIMTIVKEGMKYRLKNNEPLKREEVLAVNRLVLDIGFKIPELWDTRFLNSLPASSPQPPATQPIPKPVDTPEVVGAKKRQADIRRLHSEFLSLMQEPDSQKRGYLFERFLNDLFEVHGLSPRKSFKVVGEQLDGSFEWQGDTFLVEARWRNEVAQPGDLFVLRGKVEGKSDWTRGLFVSINGFSTNAGEAYTRGRAADIITMDGCDLFLILDERWALIDAIKYKLRHAGETGEIIAPLSKAHQ